MLKQSSWDFEHCEEKEEEEDTGTILHGTELVIQIGTAKQKAVGQKASKIQILYECDICSDTGQKIEK